MMSEWREYKLGELTELVTKGTTPTTLGGRFVEKGVNFIKSESVSYDGRIDKSKFVYVDEATHHKLKRSQLAKDDILFSMAGIFLGKNAIVTEDILPANTNQALSIIRLNQGKAIPRYVHYYLRQESVIEFINNMSGQSAQPNINFEEIKSIHILLPPLPEQQVIASILSSLDDKIDLLHGQNATLEAMAETLFRQWFVEEAKEEWEEVKLGDFVKTNQISISKNYPYKVIEYLDTGSLTEGMISSFQTLTIEEAPSRAKRLVKHNDVLLSTVRPNQKHYGIIKNPIETLVVSTGFCVITCTNIDPHFVYLLLTHKDMTEYLHSIAEGSTSTYPSLKPSDIESIKFLLPNKESLDKFSEIATQLWKKLELNQIQIRTLITFRNTLLPKLMSGEIKAGMT